MVGCVDWKNILLFAAEKRLVERAVVILHVIAERRNIVGIILSVERRLIIENRVSAAQAGLSVLERVPGKADARSQIVVVRIGDHVAERVASAISGRPFVAVIEQAGKRILEDR